MGLNAVYYFMFVNSLLRSFLKFDFRKSLVIKRKKKRGNEEKRKQDWPDKQLLRSFRKREMKKDMKTKGKQRKSW